MFSILCAGIFFILYFQFGLSLPVENNTIQNLDSKIVGGYCVQDRRKFAYQASLRKHGQHICGASILNQKCVVTASHCVSNSGSGEVLSTSWFKVAVGHLELSGNSIIKSVESIIIHEKYDPNTNINDIAIVKIHGKFELTPHVKPIPMPLDDVKSGTGCVISGWGRTQPIGSISNCLMYTTVPIVDFKVCSRLLLISPGMICAGLQEGGKDSCQGDSGGPLVCNGKLTGIVSWGVGCALPKLPGVYTDVYKYIDWISENSSPSYQMQYSYLLMAFVANLIVSTSSFVG